MGPIWSIRAPPVSCRPGLLGHAQVRARPYVNCASGWSSGIALPDSRRPTYLAARSKEGLPELVPWELPQASRAFL